MARIFLHVSNEGGFHIGLLAFRRFRDVGHHDDVIDGTDGSCALILSVAAVILAARAFVSWAVVHDMPEEVTESTGVVVIFGSRAMDGIEVFLLRIPKGPLESTLVIEQHSLLTREKFEVFLCTRLSRDIS